MSHILQSTDISISNKLLLISGEHYKLSGSLPQRNELPETEIISQSEHSHLHKVSWIWGLGKQY